MFNNVVKQIKPSNYVRNLGVYLDRNMTISTHISSFTHSLNVNLRNIGRIRRYVDENTCNHAVRWVVLSRLDYSNSLLYHVYGITAIYIQNLPNIQNRSARLLFRANPTKHTSPFLPK